MKLLNNLFSVPLMVNEFALKSEVEKLKIYLNNQANVNSKAQIEQPKRIGIIPMHGMLVANAGWLGELMGWVDPQAIARQAEAFANNPDIAEVILWSKSPGGATTKMPEAFDAMRMLASKKRITAYNDTEMTSGALFIGAAATEIVTAKDAYNGSVGVVWQHADFSAMLESEGIDIETYRTGDFKALGQETDPNDEKMQALASSQLDFWLNEFSNAVALGRGMTQQKVLDTYALNKDGSLKGGVVYGAEAVQVGLADKVGTFNQVLAEVSARVSKKTFSINIKRKETMDIEKMLAVITSPDVSEESIGAGLKEFAQVSATSALTAFKDSQEYKGLTAQAEDGKAYRESLLTALEKVTVAIDGKGSESQAVADRARRIYSNADMSDLKAEVERLEAQVAAMLPAKQSKDKAEINKKESYEV